MFSRKPTLRPSVQAAFTLLELLVAVTILAIIIVSIGGIINMMASTSSRIGGKLEEFEAARTAFDTIARSIRQASLTSYLGYDDPRSPKAYVLRSDLQFICGPQKDLGISDSSAANSHGIFFQMPDGFTDDTSLKATSGLLNATGFFLSYGPDTRRPSFLSGKTDVRNRFRLNQFLEPREFMEIYTKTIQVNSDGIPEANDSYDGTDWFAGKVNQGQSCHVLAENVIALVIVPIMGGQPASSYLWNSRSTVPAVRNRLPQSVKLAMAVIDERSAAKLGNGSAAPEPLVLGSDLFIDPANFETDIATLESRLNEVTPKINYRIFKTEIPLNASNTLL